MPGASAYTRDNVMNAILRGVALPLPARTYVSLHTADPTAAGNNEVNPATWTGYVRRDAEVGAAIGTGWTAAAAGQCKNAKQITYPPNAGLSTVTVTHFAVWDALAAGNMIAYGTLTMARAVQPGDIVVFDVQTLTATLT